MYENKPALGYQNFEEVRIGHIFYIDKTDFIREWWENADKVTLITHPRRFYGFAFRGKKCLMG